MLQGKLEKGLDRWVPTRSDRADGRERAGTACGETLVSKEHIQNTSGPGKQRGASTQAGRLAAGHDIGKTEGADREVSLDGQDNKSVHLVTLELRDYVVGH